MRPPITYALIPFLLGTPLCISGITTIETFSIITLMVAFVYWWKNKRDNNFLLYKSLAGIIMGVVFVIVCNCVNNKKLDIIRKEENCFNTRGSMPPRELKVSICVKNRKTIGKIKGKRYVLYSGNIIRVPDVRSDLLRKEISWIEEYKKREEIILVEDHVTLIGVIKYRQKNKWSRNKKDVGLYIIEQEVVLDIEHDTGLYSYLKRKIFLSLIREESDDSEYQGFAYALLMGDKDELKFEQVRLFKETGTMHLFAVSGLHVGIVYLICSFCICRIFKKREISIFISLLFVFGYVGLIGYTSSACRAFVMISMWQTSLILHKKSNPISVLYWATIILLIITPSSLFSLGFQLSFTVVLNILFIVDNSFATKKFNVYNCFRIAFLISYSSFWGSSLLMIDHFHFINPFSIFINAILVNVIFIAFVICLIHVIIAITFQTQFHSVMIETVHNIMDFTLRNFNEVKFFQFRFSGDLDIPDIIHLIYPLVLIFLQPYLHRLWHKILVLSCLPLIFLFGSMCVT